MNCIDFEDAAQRLLDQRSIAVSPEMSKHLATCGECRAFWHSQLWLIEAAGAETAVDVPLDLMHAVLEKLTVPTATIPGQVIASSAASHRSAPSHRGLTAALCSTAALALIAVSLARRTEPHDRQPAVVARSTASTAPVAETLLESQTLSRLWSGMHAEYQQLSQETTQTLDSFAELPRPRAILLNVSPLESPLTEPLDSWLRVDRPISERVGEAFDFLWDALPSDTGHSS